MENHIHYTVLLFGTLPTMTPAAGQIVQQGGGRRREGVTITSGLPVLSKEEL